MAIQNEANSTPKRKRCPEPGKGVSGKHRSGPLFGARGPFKSQNLQKVCFRSSPLKFLKYRFSTGGYAPNAALGLPLELQGPSKIAPGGRRDLELCFRARETLTFHENERLACMRAPSGTSDNPQIHLGLAPGTPFGKTRFFNKNSQSEKQCRGVKKEGLRKVFKFDRFRRPQNLQFHYFY